MITRLRVKETKSDKKSESVDKCTQEKEEKKKEDIFGLIITMISEIRDVLLVVNSVSA